MSKEEFVQSVNVSESVAEKAWSQADGDESQARELLKKSTVWIKGSFVSSSDSMTGFFLIEIDPVEYRLNSVNGLVLNDTSVDEIDVDMDTDKFIKSLEYLQSSDRSMNASTDQLNEILSEHSGADSDLMDSVLSGEFEDVNSKIDDILSREFDVQIDEVTSEMDVERNIDSKKKPETSQKSDGEEKEAVLSCDVEITPVKGVPVTKLQSGDKIFVDIREADPSDRQIQKRLEATKDQKTGMVPTTIVSKESSGPGKLRLKTKFAENVFGEISCGNDISIRVPEDVLNRYQGSGDGDFLAELDEHKAALSIGAGVIILLLVVGWLLI